MADTEVDTGNGSEVNFDERLPFKSKLAYGLSQASMSLLVGIEISDKESVTVDKECNSR